jgi:hypothetical protein
MKKEQGEKLLRKRKSPLAVIHVNISYFFLTAFSCTCVESLINSRKLDRTMSTEIHEDPNDDDSSSLSMIIPSLLTLPFDCRIAILQCVPNLSDIACSCRQLRHERDHPSLDPMRTATIRFREPTSGETLVQSLKHMKDVLGKTGFPLELQLTGSAYVIPTDFSRYSHLVRQWSLPQVRLLDLSNGITTEDDEPKRIDISVLMFLAMVLPNLLEIDLTGMQTNQFSLSFLSWKSPQLRCIYWNAAGVDQPASGLHLSACHNLQELYLDDCIFSIIGDDEERMFGDTDEEDRSDDDDDTLFRCCRSQLQRVSVRNAMYRVYDDRRQIKPFTQFCLMRFVRATPTLRWFGSDLTPDSCLQLQQERPHILFA